METSSPRDVTFTLEDIVHSAEAILGARPAGIVAYRLVNEVLRLPHDDPRAVSVKTEAMNSKWVQQLEGAQLADGSWGRFHSQDTKIKSAFRTTEEAIDRAFALGLSPESQVLSSARQYIVKVLNREAHISDRDEKNEAWPLLIKLILVGRLAQLDPSSPLLEAYWTYLAEVVKEAFKSGSYRLEDEVEAHYHLTGIHLPQGFLESQHALWILSSRRLPSPLEQKVLDWVWHKPDGIRYLRAPLANPIPRRIGYWLLSMNILTRFHSWREFACDQLNRLWEGRDDDGLWDFGSKVAKNASVPLSASWRKPGERKFDYSTHILALMRKFFD